MIYHLLNEFMLVCRAELICGRILTDISYTAGCTPCTTDSPLASSAWQRAAKVPLAEENYAKYKQKSFVFVHKHDVYLYLESEKIFNAKGRLTASTLLVGW